ncbi:MAG: mucoidy inhibitor MuiA family protein [Flavobacteriales bacterium]|nr:mucoidy inhibitor MuiA family protein [Flavobacteriales bacterium]
MHTRLILLFALCYGHLGAKIHEVEVDSKVENVVVYHTGAEVTRSFSCDLKQGLNRVAISNLSKQVIKNHIRIMSQNKAEVMNIEYLMEENLKRIPKKDSMRILAMRDTINNLVILKMNEEAVKQDFKSERKLLLEAQNRVRSNELGVTLADFKEMLSYYRLRSAEITKEIIRLEKKIEAYNKEIAAIESRVAALSKAKKGVSTWNFYLTIQSPKDANESFEIKYITGSVGWGPKYHMNVSEVSNEIDLDYYAYIVNQSGEDWIEVPMKLVSAMPLESQEEPTLEPWVLDRYARAVNNSSTYVSSSQAQAQYGDVKILEGVQYREVEIAALGIEFDLKRSYSILSDSKPNKIKIKEHKVPASFTYYAAPKIDPNAYLIASIGGWEELQLIAGNVDIYNNSVFMGTSFMEPGLKRIHYHSLWEKTIS